MSKKGKTKGSVFERQIAKRLSLWLSSGKRNDLLWRTSGSGARLKTSNALSQSGDIGLVHADKNARRFIRLFSVECKHVAELRFHQFIFGGDTGIKAYWLQAEEDAEKANKWPMLIARQNRWPITVIIPKHIYTKLKFEYMRRTIHCGTWPNAFISDNMHCVVMDFEKLLACIKPENLTAIHPRRRITKRVLQNASDSY